MTDRFFALTVILNKDIREDDAEAIIQAIQMIKGVGKVQPHISSPEFITAEFRAQNELRDKILEIFYPKNER